MGKTKAPTGLKFTRKAKNVVLTWKIGDKNYRGGQKYTRNIISGKNVYDKKQKKDVWKSSKASVTKAIGTKVTTLTTAIDPKKYFPYTKTYLTSINIGVMGKKSGGSWSAKTWRKGEILRPKAPTITAVLSDTYDNQTTFNWVENDDDTKFTWFTDFERETLLIKDCNESDGSKVSWKGATKYPKTADIGKVVRTQTITEDTPFQGYYSYTRWYRARTRGPRGVSVWKYARHVYAMPAYATVKLAEVADKNVARGLYRVNLKWAAYATTAHPIDSTSVEYLVTTPVTKTTIETNADGIQYSHTEFTPPPMSGATSVSVTKDTAGEDGIVFSVPNVAEEDQCVVVRVNTKHDNNVGTGATTYVKGSYGTLKDPTLTSVGTVNPQTRRVSISVTNNSSVPNSHVAITYKTVSNPSNLIVVGIVPPGKSNITVILPESCLTESFTIGAYARVGDYAPVAPNDKEYTAYSLSNNLMTSNTVWGEGSVPLPPQNVALVSPKVGTIRVMWDWSWQDATGAELSWSSEEDAWESTNEPQTYIIDNTNAGAWNISGLDVGTWYVRIRLLKQDGESIAYGSYSETKNIKLAAAPDTPGLTLSDSVIPQDGSVTCYWVYTTNDGTSQLNADICEAIQQEDGSFLFNEENIIARAGTVQYYTILASDRGWKAGETHYLAVRVTSASGETSNSWSTPVAITIADAPDIRISDTSLISVSEVIGEGEDQVINTYLALDKMPLTVSLDLNDPYFHSEDTSVVEGKTYYIRTGSGTEEDPYVYTPDPPPFIPSPDGYYERQVTPVHVDPSANGYYEEEDLEYFLSIDTEWDRTKTYYEQHGEEGDYTYTAVPEPPEEEIEYNLTSDISWDDTKEYYFRAGDGSVESPYEYSLMEKPIEDPETLDYYERKELKGEVTYILERAESYHIDRPDETEFEGFEGETIAILGSKDGEQISIDNNDLIGILDDGAKYNLIATITDSYGQSASTEPLSFVVKWAHQAVMPEAEIEVFDEDIYTTILPIAPTGYELSQDTEVNPEKTYYIRSGDGTEEDPYVYTEVDSPFGNPKEQSYYETYNSSADVCDIYRLSVDQPELIVDGAAFGTKYVDPYPTLNTFGGYRVVYRTGNNDYITEDNRLAWEDYTDAKLHQIDRFLVIVDFDKERILLPYDIELSSKWNKDFTETKYLGGAVQGDWNPAVSRSSTVKTDTIVFEDPETIKSMRRLADFAGICHIRTPDGSNFSANINVNEDRSNKFVNKLAKFSLDITRVDSPDLDGEPYDTWMSEDE